MMDIENFMKIFRWGIYGLSAVVITLTLYSFLKLPTNHISKKVFHRALFGLILGFIINYMGQLLTLSALNLIVELINESIPHLPIFLLILFLVGLILWACDILFLLLLARWFILERIHSFGREKNNDSNHY